MDQTLWGFVSEGEVVQEKFREVIIWRDGMERTHQHIQQQGQKPFMGLFLAPTVMAKALPVRRSSPLHPPHSLCFCQLTFRVYLLILLLPASGPWHMLFPLSGTPFLPSLWSISTHPLGFPFNVTSSGRASLTIPRSFKAPLLDMATRTVYNIAFIAFIAHTLN